MSTRPESLSRTTQRSPSEHPALTLLEAGYLDLIPIVPPHATLSPGSSLKPNQRGKCPGELGPFGWRGLPAWEGIKISREQLEGHVESGASIGLRTRRHPMVDVDVLDPDLAALIEQIIVETIGVGPKRVGRSPKFAMPCRSDRPFGKIRLALKRSDRSDAGMIEVLADGQQFVWRVCILVQGSRTPRSTMDSRVARRFSPRSGQRRSRFLLQKSSPSAFCLGSMRGFHCSA
jgi:hypothetical protein